MKTVYLCLDRNVIVEKPNVKVEQLGTVLCQDKNLERKIGQVNVVQLNSKRGVQVVSALKVIDCSREYEKHIVEYFRRNCATCNLGIHW